MTEEVNELPKEVVELIEKQSEIISTLTDHMIQVESLVTKSTELLTSWKPSEEVLMEVKFLVLGKIESGEVEPDRLERLQQAATWLDLFEEGEP